MKKLGVFFICGLVSVFLLAGIAAAKETVVVYTSLENEEVVEYLKVAKKELAELDIQAIRLSTGELGARMLAEKDNPQADCIWGWAVTNMSEFVPKGMLVPYKPKGWDKIPANFKDPDGNWTAIDYKNKPVEQNKAWDFLKKLDKNMGQYIKSGSKPAKLTAAGEYAVGASFAFVYSSLKKKGFPVALVMPQEGAGFELEANALLKGAKHEAAAKKFLDWAISKQAMGEYAKFKLGVTYPGVSGPKDLPALKTIKLAPMDFPWQSKNRAKILEVWQNHFLR
jgi:iron(III) transport system substrate-binding protein